MTRMFLNWIRWQCLNREDWNDGEIPAGTMIDDDQFRMFMLGRLMDLRKRRRIYCKYCGAELISDVVGKRCPTRNCQWEHGM